MPIVHWLGAGLSSVPGIRRLVQDGFELVLWNRTLEKAERALEDTEHAAVAKRLEWDSLENSLNEGDVVVSMLPATMHLKVAAICLTQKAHFVSSSYVSQEMQALCGQAQQLGLCFVNEVGLDPGLDHLMAHVLVRNYRNSDFFDVGNEHFFRSYCGGFPKNPNEFKYKFSWSPLGVLRALKSPAQWMADGEVQTTAKPWTSITKYETRLPNGSDTFQAYPNRDSLPFLSDYQFGEDWNIQEFVRGTLRLDGWAEAWQEIFELIESLDGDDGHDLLARKSDQLWNQYRYESDEPDRVVLSVDLQVDKGGQTVWHQAFCLDAHGNETGSAMARLVSLTTSIAVESVLTGQIAPGVSPAPKDIETVNNWLNKMSQLGENFERFEIV